MKVPINQTNVSRVGINTARIQGIRLGSASREGQTSPFHPSLVDYWNFKGKSNFDKDRNTIKGIKGEILTAYNFGWSLGSGYGLFKENYLTYSKVENVFITDDHSVTIMNFVPANKWVIYKYGNSTFKSTKIKVTGITADNQLEYGYSPSLEEARVMIPIPKDGIYDLPESVTNQAEFNIGFFLRSALTKNVTIEQIPEYEGAIVTDGVDDYLKLDKVGYKIGTVILKYIPIPTVNRWQYVFDNTKQRNYIAYSSKDAVENNQITSSFLRIIDKGDYKYAVNNVPKEISTPLVISSNVSLNEFLSMTLYEIAIYQDVLTDEEIQKEINVMEYGTPNPVFALNFDNFAYKVTDYPEMFGIGKATTNKIIMESTQEGFNGAIAVAMNPEADTGDPIEVPSYKIKVTGLNQYSVGEGNWAVGLMGMMIDSTKDPWTYPISKDGIYDIPAISLSDGIFNLGVMAQIAIDKPIEIEILYDKNIAKNFPETKQIFP